MMYQMFGDSPAIKILDWMLDNQEYDHSVKEIADGAKLTAIVIKRNFEPLLKYGVVKVSRQIGRDSMYVLDVQSRCTKAIIEFDKQVAKCCEEPTKDETNTREFREIDEAHERFMAGPVD